LEAHTNVKDLNLLEAKMNFIRSWQSLPDYGVSLFVARFLGEKKDELMGIAFNRLMRMNLHSGDHIKTWRFNTIKVGWQIFSYLFSFYFTILNRVFLPELTFLGYLKLK
jgi:kindlin 2